MTVVPAAARPPWMARTVRSWIESFQRFAGGLGLVALAVSGCQKRDGGQDLVIAATGEPETLVPPLITASVGRDIADLVYERLAVLRTGASPIDTTGFQPGLAASWTRVDSLTWRFTLRPGAAWQDGQPVTVDDVIFSFNAYVDTSLGGPAAQALGGVTVGRAGPDVEVRFPRAYPEQLYDATSQVRIMPRHLWDSIPRSRWGADSSVGLLAGSGRYRITKWVRGQSLIAERVRGDGFQRIAWRFTGDQDAALSLVLAGEADLLETLTSPSARDRAGRDSTVRLEPYPSAVYGFLGFRVADSAGTPHPILGDRLVRQALTHAIDRASLVKAVIGPDAAVPPGPVSRAAWIWNDSVTVLGYDPSEAKRLLDRAGWPVGPDGVRRRGGRPLAIELLVPSTSTARKQLAEGIEQMWKAVGVGATIAAVDFPVFQERLGSGRYDAMVGAWLDEPSPRSLADQWTKAGFGALNQGRYFDPRFDSLFAAASNAPTPAAARPLWKAAFDTLNAGAPAVFLYSPTNVLVASRRLSGVTIDPFAWLHEVAAWRKSP